MKLFRAGGSAPDRELDMSEHWILRTDSGVDISFIFLNEFFETIDQAVLLKVNGERYTFRRQLSEWGQPEIKVSYAKNNEPVRYAPLQPMPPEPEITLRGPRKK